MKFIIFLIGVFITAGTSTAQDLSNLEWLSGAWQGTASWGQPVSLTISNSYEQRILASETIFESTESMKISSFEHFEIRQANGKIFLQVFPRGQKSLIMDSTFIGPHKVVFENSNHDFPKIWSFELIDDNTLIEKASGDSTGIQITFQRVE